MGKYSPEGIFCIVCGTDAVLHHVRTRGSGGSDGAHNLMPLCRRHHTEIHAQGNRRFADKFPAARAWLVENSWTFCPVMLKWTHGLETHDARRTTGAE